MGFDLNMAYQIAKGQDDLVKDLYQIVEAHKPYKREDRKDIQEKFSDLKQLIVFDSLDKSRRLTPIGAQKRDQLLEKYGAQNAPEVIAGIVGEINERYNLRNTDEARWVDLKVQFLEYRAKNYQELTELKKLESEAECLQADYLAQKARDYQQELVKEENELCQMVQNLNPEDYHKTSRLIQENLSLYGEDGRTSFLMVYNQHVKGCGDDFDRMAILSANEYWGKKDKSELEVLTQSAQAFRGKPERENLGDDERTQYVEALRAKLELEKSRRPSFNNNAIDRTR